ncbi:hypothetical protein G7Y89_g5854 [Cudoniella acicularis]|uniref:Uncharacterized protein n=1 Tax=Cudoniella acicularis TaxID=354080 RepID=A0A8H4RMH1_9HELO|nr:hypothetical protein G7Y89_g5854 [Cudoniella acicularis]
MAPRHPEMQPLSTQNRELIQKLQVPGGPVHAITLPSVRPRRFGRFKVTKPISPQGAGVESHGGSAEKEAAPTLEATAGQDLTHGKTNSSIDGDQRKAENSSGIHYGSTARPTSLASSRKKPSIGEAQRAPAAVDETEQATSRNHFQEKGGASSLNTVPKTPKTLGFPGTASVDDTNNEGGVSFMTPVSRAAQKSRKVQKRAKLRVPTRPHSNAAPAKTYSGSRSIVSSQGQQVALARPGDVSNESSEESQSNVRSDDEELDDVDRELLGLRPVLSQRSPRSSIPYPIPSTRNSKRNREDIDSPDRYKSDLRSSDADDEDENVEEPEAKRRRRSNRQVPNVENRRDALKELKKKRESGGRTYPAKRSTKVTAEINKKSRTAKKKASRSLPVDELLVVSERLYSSDLGENSAEMLEDPISQLSSQEQQPEQRKRKIVKTKITFKPSKGFKMVDQSKFRMPKPITVSPNTSRPLRRSPSYSDGFEGKEAEPIGRVMAVRYSGRRQYPVERTSIHIPELTIVREKHIEEEVRNKPKKRRQQRKADETAEDPMLIDNDENEGLKGDSDNNRQHYKDQGSHIVQQEEQGKVELATSNGVIRPRSSEDISHPPVQAAPKVHKQKSSKCRSTMSVNSSEGARSDAKIRGNSIGPLEQPDSRLQANALLSTKQQADDSPRKKASVTDPSGILRTFKHSTARSTPKSQIRTAEQEEIIASQQLMMVVVPRLIESDDSEDTEDGEDSEEDEEDEAGDEDEDIEEDEEVEERENVEPEDQVRSHEEKIHENICEVQCKDNNTSDQESDSESERSLSVEEDEQQMSQREISAPVVSDKMLEGNDEHGPSEESFEDKGEDLGKNAAEETSPRLVEGQIIITSLREHKIDNTVAEQSLNKAHTEDDIFGAPVQEFGQNDASQEIVQQETSLLKSELDTQEVSTWDSSWKPRRPRSNSVLIKVHEDDIVDSPTPAHFRERLEERRRHPSKRLGGRTHSSLTIVQSRLSPDLDAIPTQTSYSGPSIGFGDPQTHFRPVEREIPETQFEVGHEERESQESYVLTSSYFDRASQQLSDPLRISPLSRTKSMPFKAQIHPSNGNSEPLPASSSQLPIIIDSSTASTPFKTLHRLPSLYEKTSTQHKSLQFLNRKASIGLGTLPSGIKRRSMTLPRPAFVTPFVVKKEETVERDVGILGKVLA